MNLTDALKKWLVDKCDVKASATDDEYREAAAKALASGDLSTEKFAELSSTKDDDEASDFQKLMKDLGGTLTDIKGMLADGKSSEGEGKGGEGKGGEGKGGEGKGGEGKGGEGKGGEGKAEHKDGKCPICQKDMTKGGEKSLECKDCGLKMETKEPPTGTPGGAKGGKRTKSPLEKMVMSMAGTPTDPDDGEKDFPARVKEAMEQYDTTKSALVYPDRTEKDRPHPLAGKPVKNFNGGVGGRSLDLPSDLDMAVAGAYGKFVVNQAKLKSRTLSFMQLPQHDKELLCYAMESMKWGGSTTGEDLADIKDRKLTAIEQKALIDDSTSGGLEAAPIVFDDMVIQTPLLNGELFPLVNTVPLDRGRRIEGVATGTVTGSWGGVDDTAISLFNTASYVSAFDTTIFRWEGAIRIGLDFLSDTPIDFGQHITSQYGERLLEDLDDVIATGNGTTQPEGVMNKSGTTSVAFGGSTSLGNYESLRFGVAKPEHRANLRSSIVFCGTETSYQRAHAIPVGASDARRLGGMNYDSYEWMGRPYKINESLSNQQIFYAILARYRMYRRRGLTMRTSTEGDTLIRRNEMLMVAMARYGGQLERGAVAAVTTTAPA